MPLDDQWHPGVIFNLDVEIMAGIERIQQAVTLQDLFDNVLHLHGVCDSFRKNETRSLAASTISDTACHDDVRSTAENVGQLPNLETMAPRRVKPYSPFHRYTVNSLDQGDVGIMNDEEGLTV